MKSLAVAARSATTFPDVPTLKEATGLGWTIAA